jgi:hypothetical protein
MVDLLAGAVAGVGGTSPESGRCFISLPKFSAASVFVLVLFSRMD